jgi:hypothetical protein
VVKETELKRLTDGWPRGKSVRKARLTVSVTLEAAKRTPAKNLVPIPPDKVTLSSRAGAPSDNEKVP